MAETWVGDVTVRLTYTMEDLEVEADTAQEAQRKMEAIAELTAARTLEDMADSGRWDFEAIVERKDNNDYGGGGA